MDKKNFLMLTVLLTVSNVIWMHSFSKIGIGLTDAVDFGKIMSALAPGNFFMLVLTGLFMSLAIFLILFYSNHLKRRERTMSAIISVLIAIPFAYSNYQGKGIFLLMSFFYMLGMVFVSASTRQQAKSASEKMKIGWAASKKLTYLLAIGGIALTLFFSYSNLEEYQNNAKDSITELASNSLEAMNMANLLQSIDFSEMFSSVNTSGAITEHEMEQIVRNSITREQIEERLIISFGESDWNSFDASYKNSLIEETYEKTIEDYMNTYDASQMQITFDAISVEIAAKMQQKLIESEEFKKQQTKMSKELIEQMTETIPFLKLFFDFLPIISGLTVFAVILVFGELLLGPITAFLSLMLPTNALKKPREFKIDEFAGLPFKYREMKRKEEKE